jgi:hypothetical protein
MFKALGDYFISSQGSTFPINIYTPPQIFGNELLSWYDFNDTSTLYTNSALTTNVVNNNDLILGVRNKGTGNGRNYNLNQINTTANVHQYKKNAINSNRNLANFTGSTTTASLVTRDAYVLTSTTSSYTFSFCYKNPLTTGNHILFTLSETGFNQVISMYYNATTNTFEINIKSGSGIVPNGGSLASLSWAGSGALQATELKYNVFTLTINANSLVTLYHNDAKATFTGNTNLHPISSNSFSSTQRAAMNWSVGGSFQSVSSTNSQILEVVISDKVCATDEQVNNLRQYFKIKYNI